MQLSLESMGHKQNPVPLKTDNSTANSFVHENIKQRKSKTWDMRFNWLRDRSFKRDVRIFWDKGENNHADYFTKHHPPAHHREIRSKYILQK